MPLACSRRHLGGSEPMHRARQFSQLFLGCIFKERPAQMEMEKPPAWFHWSYFFLVNLAALNGKDALSFLFYKIGCRRIPTAHVTATQMDESDACAHLFCRYCRYRLISFQTAVARKACLQISSMSQVQAELRLPHIQNLQSRGSAGLRLTASCPSHVRWRRPTVRRFCDMSQYDQCDWT